MGAGLNRQQDVDMNEAAQEAAQVSGFLERRSQSAMRTEAKARMARVAPIVLVFYMLYLLPPEVEFSVYGVLLSSFRIALLVVAVPVAWRLANKGVGRIQFMDTAAIIIGFWIMLSFMSIYGIGDGLKRGGGIFIDMILTYFVARTSIKSFDDMRYFLLMILPAIVIAGCFLVLESFSRTLIVRPAFASVFGHLSAYSGGEAEGSLVIKEEFRLGGLMRAYGVFPHPILGGIMMIGLLPLYYFSSFRSWPYILGIIVPLTGFFGLSSAAFLALIIVCGAIAIHHAKAFVPQVSWWTISALLVVALWAVHMGTKNGILPVLSRLTLAPHTADYRQEIWRFGWQNVLANPWFGLGYRYWARPSWMGESVDAHFLLLAMRHGLLVAVVILVAMLYGMIKLGMTIPHLPAKDRRLAVGVNICVVCFLTVGQTVNYFGSSVVVFMTTIALLASSVSIGEEAVAAAKRQRLFKNARIASLAAARVSTTRGPPISMA